MLYLAEKLNLTFETAMRVAKDMELNVDDEREFGAIFEAKHREEGAPPIRR